MTFGKDLRSFATKTGIALDTVMRKVCIDLVFDLVRLTPVDTGMAKNNWFLGTNRLDTVDQTTSKKGSASSHRAVEFSSTVKAGSVFYIVNNLPYVMQLEFGSSKQAPAGMARITVDRWQKTVDRIVRELR